MSKLLGRARVVAGRASSLLFASTLALLTGCSDQSTAVENGAQAAEPVIVRRAPMMRHRHGQVSEEELRAAAKAETKLPVYAIQMEPDQSMAMEASVHSDERFPATFEHNGVVFENVKIRYRGAWARTWPKKPLKLFFNDAKQFREQRRLNLNSAWRDPSFIRETVAYRVYDAAGCPASKSRLARVHMNGMFRGLYVEVEQPDKEFLQKRNLKGATIFKASSRARQADERDLGAIELYRTHYEQETQKDEEGSYAELQSFCRELASSRDVLDFFNRRVDLEKYVNYLAASIFTQNWDGYNKNHFLVYNGKGSKKWFVVPWDLDRSLGDHWDWSFGNAELPIELGTRNMPGITGWNRLLDRFLSEPTLRARLADRLEELLETEFTPGKMNPVIDQLAAECGPEAALDRRVWPSQDPDFAGAVEGVKQFIKDRREFLLRELPRFRRGGL